MAKKINKKELERGAKVEMEHAETIKKYMRKNVSVKTVAKSISRDHLNESPDYYKKLARMEKLFKDKDKKKK